MATARTTTATTTTLPRRRAGGHPHRRPRPISRARMPLLLGGLGIVLVGAITLAVALVPVAVPFVDTWRVIGHHLIPATVDPPGDPLYDQFIWNFRLPRALLGAVIGMALALVGAALQAVGSIALQRHAYVVATNV